MTTQIAPPPNISERPHEVACRRIWRGSIAFGTTVAALIAWTFLDKVSHVDLAVRSGDSVRHIGAVAVGGTAAVVSLAAWGLLALIEKRTARPFRVWVPISLAVFLISLLGPLGGTTGSAKAALAALHASVAAVLIIGMLLVGRRR